MALTDSLLGYYKLDEASGNRLSSSGSVGAALVPAGSPTQTAGKLTDAVDLGAGNKLAAGNSDYNVPGGSFFLSAWVLLHSLPGSDATVLARWDGTSGNEYRLYWNAGVQRFSFVVAQDGGFYPGTADHNAVGAPATGTWHHVVSYYDLSALQFGIIFNGNTGAAATRSLSDGTGTKAVPFTVGALSGGTGDFDGAVDALGIWGRAYTSGDVDALYNAGSGDESWLPASAFNPAWAMGSNRFLGPGVF